METNKKPTRPVKKKPEYVAVQHESNGRIHKTFVKKSLTLNKQFMAENGLELIVEPNTESIKEQLEKDKEVLKSKESNTEKLQSTNK